MADDLAKAIALSLNDTGETPAQPTVPSPKPDDGSGGSVAQFLGFTGTDDVSAARAALGAAGGDVRAAVQMFFSSGGSPRVQEAGGAEAVSGLGVAKGLLNDAWTRLGTYCGCYSAGEERSNEAEEE